MQNNIKDLYLKIIKIQKEIDIFPEKIKLTEK